MSRLFPFSKNYQPILMVISKKSIFLPSISISFERFIPQVNAYQLIKQVNHFFMKKTVMLCVLAVSAAIFMSSCARGITVQEAANGKAKCGRSLR
jgi:hypothetical protein